MSSLLCNDTHSGLVIFTEVSERRMGPIFKRQAVQGQEGIIRTSWPFWPLMNGPIHCLKTSAMKHTYSTILEERRPLIETYLKFWPKEFSTPLPTGRQLICLSCLPQSSQLLKAENVMKRGSLRMCGNRVQLTLVSIATYDGY